MIKLGLLTFENRRRFDLAQLFHYATVADQLKFSRFWLGEHYDSPSLWNNPEPLLPVMLGMTDQIKVGAAGIILRLHSAFRVASSFKLINAMYPNRVDLGLAGGYTNDAASQRLVGVSQRESSQIDFGAKVREIVSFYGEEQHHQANGLYVAPTLFPTPAVWLLGSSQRGLQHATQLGLNYSISTMHHQKPVALLKEDLQRARDQFYQLHGRLPQINLAFSGICAADRSTAKQLYAESPVNTKMLHATLLGNMNRFTDQIYQWQEQLNIDEFVFLDMAPDMNQRIELLAALAENFQLQRQQKKAAVAELVVD